MSSSNGYSKSQSYEKIKAHCSQQDILFEDPQFPATDRSIYFSRSPPVDVKWRRPNEIVKNPEFFVDGFSRFDICQGELGNCWFLAALSSLAEHPKLFRRVVPTNQSFTEDYCGLFHFQFWQFGEWVDVVVDDRLPTRERDGTLMFMQSASNDEFWSPLLEKAYAKLCGSYESLFGGTQSEAMVDLTGGVTQTFLLLKGVPDDLFDILLKSFKKKALIGCGIQSRRGVYEHKRQDGLVMGHAYSITSVAVVPYQGESVPLIRIRNPWGDDFEWNGAWSDGSWEWHSVSDKDKEELGIVYDNDGEFWMSYDDFINIFYKVEICTLVTDLVNDNGDNDSPTMQMIIEQGEWRKDASAGGCFRTGSIETFASNPQYFITVPPDEDGLSEIVVNLLQTGTRQKESQIGHDVEMLSIGYSIFPAPDVDNGPLELPWFKRMFMKNKMISSEFINTRGVCNWHHLEPGNYVIVPSTFNKNQEGDFVVRIFSESACDINGCKEPYHSSSFNNSMALNEKDSSSFTEDLIYMAKSLVTFNLRGFIKCFSKGLSSLGTSIFDSLNWKQSYAGQKRKRSSIGNGSISPKANEPLAKRLKF